MVFIEAKRLTKRVGIVSTEFIRGLMLAIRRDLILQWTVVGVTGILLGLYVLVFPSLPRKWAFLSLLVVMAPFMLMIVSNVKRLLLAIILFELPLQLDIYLNYQDELAALRVSFAGLNISLTTVCLAVLYALWLSELLTKATTLTLSRFYLNRALVVYLVAVSISVVTAYNATLSFYELFILGQTFLLYVYIVHTVRTRQDVLFVMTILIIGLILQGLIMIGLRGIGHSISIAFISARIDGARVGGTLGSPNTTAAYLTLLIAPSLSILITQLGYWYKQLAAVAFSLGGVALILTFSRGGWTAVAISVTLLGLFAWHRGWLPLKSPIVILVFAVLILVFFQDSILARVIEDDGGSAESRIPLMKLAFRLIRDHPLFGVGANNFAIVVRRYVTPEFSGEYISAVHNKFLLIWAETGAGALVAFIWFLMATIRQGWQSWQRRDRSLSPIALGLTLAIVGQMFHMTVARFSSRPQIQMLWLVAGIITAIHYTMGGETSPSDSETKRRAANWVPSANDRPMLNILPLRRQKRYSPFKTAP